MSQWTTPSLPCRPPILRRIRPNEAFLTLCARVAYTKKFEISRRSTDRKSTRLNSSHSQISYAVFCLKKKNTNYVHRHSSSMIRLEGRICPLPRMRDDCP